MTDGNGNAWLIWAAFMAGGGLLLLVLGRRAQRFATWRRGGGGGDVEGDIVLGDGVLRAGQPLTVLPARGGSHVPGRLTLADRRTLAVSLDTSEHGDRAVPDVGAGAVVTVTGEGALFRFPARVRDARKDGVRPGTWHLTLSRPLWLARVQRRRHARADLRLPATLERADFRGGGDKVVAFPFHAVLVSLSCGGFRARVGGPLGASDAVALAETFPPGTLLRARLPFPALSGTPLLTRVTSCDRAAVPGGIGVRVACEFAALQPWEEEVVMQHVFQSQQGQMRSRSRFRD